MDVNESFGDLPTGDSLCSIFLQVCQNINVRRFNPWPKFFPEVVSKAKLMGDSGIPSHTWFKIVSWTYNAHLVQTVGVERTGLVFHEAKKS